MKTVVMVSALLLSSRIVLFAGDEGLPSKQMTNASVAQMVKAGVAQDLIVTAIAISEPHFRLDPESLMALHQVGVPDDIVRAMMAKQQGQPAASPAGLATGAAAPDCPWPCWRTAKVGARSSVLPSDKPQNSEVGPYGFQLGSLAAEGTGGATLVSGLSSVYPGFGGGLSVGLHRYLGIFGQGGYSQLLHGTYCDNFCTASAHLTYFAGGLELVATNRSRIVPYARFGAGYGRGVVSVSADNTTLDVSQGSVAVAFGGGVRAYIGRHFGITAGVQILHFVGSAGGNTVYMPTAGLFAQSK